MAVSIADRLRLACFTCACNLVNEIGFIHFFCLGRFFRSQRSTGTKRLAELET